MKAYRFKIKTREKFDRKAANEKAFADKTPIEKIEYTLDLCRELYNGCIQERKYAYLYFKKSLNGHSQIVQLPGIKEIRPEFENVYSQVLQDVVVRSDKAFDNFFRRIKEGEKEAGYPRFKGRDRYDSFTYPQSGFQLHGNKVHLSKIGVVTIRLSRQVEGKIKTCSIKRECDGWYVIITAETPKNVHAVKTGQIIGIDVGLKTFAALSDGSNIKNPRFYRKGEERLGIAQEKLSRKTFGSKNRIKAKKIVGKAHKKISESRKDFCHKEVNKLILAFDEFHVEDLNIKGMAEKKDESHLKPWEKKRAQGTRKSIHDAGWNLFVNILTYKAEDAGKRVIRKSAKYTSQTCSNCGYVRLGEEKLTLADRVYDCPSCEFSLDRDTNAAIVILHSTQIIVPKKRVTRKRFGSKSKTGRTGLPEIVSTGNPHPIALPIA